MATSGGIAGMTGYDVQSTVILEIILHEFEHPYPIELRPEGQDDLDLRWFDHVLNQFRHRYYQIKKATDSGPTTEWSLTRIARELLGNALDKLQGNQDEQVWVLGDRLADQVQQLLSAGRDAPSKQRNTYLKALHRLAKAEAQVTKDIDDTGLKNQLDRWDPSSIGGEIDQDIEQNVAKFVLLAASISPARIDHYRQRIAVLHTILPDVIARITAYSFYGTEQQIADRVRKVLADRYKLDIIVVKNVIFRNLRGFINDISKEPNRTITKDDFEKELVQTWPLLVVPTQPRILDEDYLLRPELVSDILLPALAREVVAPSGSGKSSLASETYFTLIKNQPEAVTLFFEIRTKMSLRDVLVGVAYSLHRRGIGDIIGLSLGLRESDTKAIEQIANAISSMPRKIFFLFDYADTEVSGEFRRDLAVFTRNLSGTNNHIIIFAQASILREISQLERSELGVFQMPLRGLHYGEFYSLIHRRHSEIDKSVVYNIFQRLTSGLPTGLLPNIAQQIAHARSLEQMQAIVDLPADQRLCAAHRIRFESLPSALQQAASRILCLSLPLPASEIIALFPNNPIKAALFALIDEGLLPPFADRVEIHETVRAGLEVFIPPSLAKETHTALADYFARHEMLPPQIHHLEKAGMGDKARKLARDRFLAGKDWNALVDYIGTRKCVTDEEVLHLLSDNIHDNKYLLRDLLPQVQTHDTAQKLLEMIKSSPERYGKDFQTTWLLQETLLKCNPSILTQIVTFVLEQPVDKRCEYIDWLLMNARRVSVTPDEIFVQYFRSLHDNVKNKVVGFLLLNPNLSRLKVALDFMQKNRLQIESRRRHMFRFPVLDLTTEEEIGVFIAALPSADPVKMLASRSALLEPFESFVWHERIVFRRVCLALLEQGATTAPMLSNAIRILIFLNERAVVSLTRHLRTSDSPVASLAWMTPAIMDATEELPELESVALSHATDINSRAVSIAIAIHLGADPGKLLEQATAVRPEEKRGLEKLMLIQSIYAPFPEAVPLLSDVLDSNTENLDIFGSILRKLSESNFPGIESLLIKTLCKHNATLVNNALVALQRSRFRVASSSILEVIHNSNDAILHGYAIPAALACGPCSTDIFREVWKQDSNVAHWQPVFVGRLRDTDESSWLIACASDSTQDWRKRRLAILAASRLPFAFAMEKIAPLILQTPVILTEESQSLQTHELLKILVEISDVQYLRSQFLRGHDDFVNVFSPIYDDMKKDLLDIRGILSAANAIGWLWDILMRYDFGSDSRAHEKVINDLHIPMLHAATLLGLRRLNRREDLFDAFRQASINWIRIRAFNELCNGVLLSDDNDGRVRSLIQNTPLEIQPILESMFARKSHRGRTSLSPRLEISPKSVEFIRMTYEQVQIFLKSEDRVNEKAIVLDINEQELSTLVLTLNPTHDTVWHPSINPKPARMLLSENSWQLRGGFALEPSSPHHEQRAALRPAVAAANRFGIDIAWHRKELVGELRDTYANRFFASLGARKDPDTFLHVLTKEADLLIPFFEHAECTNSVLPLVNERMIPVLDLYIKSGHGVFFQNLCTLICQVKTEVARPSLEKAFRRWLVLLDHLQSSTDHANSDTSEWRVVWQTLSKLQAHPYFDSIPYVKYRLLEVLIRYKQLWHGHREHILDLLRKWPPAYIQFETEVFHLADFGHYYEDKVDTYDDIADELFRCIR